MSTNDEKQSIESIVQLVFDGRESEALSAISLELGNSTIKALRFSATDVDRPGAKRDGEDEGRRDRVRLTNLYKLSVFLMDNKLWDKAVTALRWTIKLSEDMEETYFLEDSRFRKALCHKMLGQRNEMLKETEMISAVDDETFFIGDKVLGVRDLD